ncbi:eukaryotic translation initiation factor 3 subunit A isoform X2 [Sitodiplosis mosellana]|uniref:eukaryotic translation initiation factor 3 subunit A isoform X2 n=1 Tax=Sitodiplosis mosellana TaxID=263140 RepID=UPI002445186E|nr:eukaryotic translation initiation factor 3 subunit A isoform X2 [Sitodiplosis mosellana]
MSRYMNRPENALKRANEFIDVGKKSRALDTLQEVFRNKKFTYSYSESVIEPIMFKYLDLCVELKKSHIAKEGLFQYRNMFQLVNVGSLENVIRGYLKMAEERTEAAQQQSSQAVIDIDDLDNLATPESILMSAVCGEDAQDRSDRTILLPWVKFLWESYCQCLELLRVNAHCEALYHDIARMAFGFCLKYNRKMEFRKLCEKLRKHLEDICKSTNQATGVSISKPETQQLNLDTRLNQLDSAIQMELWQEAYKAIEDIHGLMNLAKKQPVAKTMANYYQKLAMVFWKAGNHLFHAAALLKLFQLTREMKKNITQEELQRMASHVLIATLAVPLPSAHPEFDRFIETDKSPLEKAQRLAVLLGLSNPPSRASLLKDMIRFNVVQLAGEQYRNLYQWLEIDFDPLNLCSRVKTITDVIVADEKHPLQQYVRSLHDVTIVRLIREISQVYQSIEFARILSLAKFTDKFSLERILVDCVRHNDMQIRIDHQENCIHFGTELSESQREDRPDGPMLQSMPSEQIRSQLVNMSIVLHRAINTINPNRKKADRDRLRAQIVESYHATKNKEHQRILQRQKMIEDLKESIERKNNEREAEEIHRQEEEQRRLKMAEQKRLELELEERARKRQADEIQQIKEKSLQEKVQQIKQTTHGQKVLKKLDEDELKKLDAEQIAKRESEELQKERKELQSKLKSQEKKVDYYERAKRQEEISLIEKYLEDKQVNDKEFWEQQEKQRIENAIAEREIALKEQQRLSRMYPDRDSFLDRLRKERNENFEEKAASFEKLLEEERKKRLAERVIERYEERKQKYLDEIAAEKKRREDEERRVKEEAERVERERRQKEREAELERSAQIQRAKDEENERKLAERRSQEQKEKENQSSWRNVPAAAAATADKPAGEKYRPPGSRAAPPTAAAAAATATDEPAQERGDWRKVPEAEAKPDRESKWRRDDNRENRGVDREIRRGDDNRDNRGGDREIRRDRRDDNRGDRRGGDRNDNRRDDRRGGDRGGDRGNDWRRGGGNDSNRGGDREIRRSDRPSAASQEGSSWRRNEQAPRTEQAPRNEPVKEENKRREKSPVKESADDGWSQVRRK